MFLSRVPSQDGRSSSVTASHAPRLHNNTLGWNSGLLWLPVSGRSRKMSPQRLPAGPEDGHYLMRSWPFGKSSLTTKDPTSLMWEWEALWAFN